MKEVIFQSKHVKKVISFRNETMSALDRLNAIKREIELLEVKRENFERYEKLEASFEKLHKAGLVERLSSFFKKVFKTSTVDYRIQQLEKERDGLVFEEAFLRAHAREAFYEQIEEYVLAHGVSSLKLSLEYLDDESAMLERRIRNLERTIKLLFAEIAKMMMDKRARFRSIIRLLFKNLDDEHNVVNNLKVNALKDYLSLTTHYGKPEFKTAPRDFMGAKA